MIVFEEIRPVHKWIVSWYVARKKEIYFLRLSKKSKEEIWVRNSIVSGDIQRIDLKSKVNVIEGAHYDPAFDNIEKFFKGYFSKGILNSIRKLYKNPKSDLAFRKALTCCLARFYYLNYVQKEIHHSYPGEKIIFIPSNGMEHYRTHGCDIYDYVKFRKQACRWKADFFEDGAMRFPLWASVISYVQALKRKFIIIGKMALWPFWLVGKCAGNLTKDFKGKRHYKYAITIISPVRQFANKVQKIDFLIDGDRIRKEQVVFLAPKGMAENNIRYFVENNLNFIEDITGFISFKTIIAIFPTYFFLLFLSLRDESFVAATGLKGVYFYAIWSSFVQNVTIEKLVTYCDYEIKSVFRNIVLEQNSCETYLYMDSSNLGCFPVSQRSGASFKHHYFGFLYYDYFIAWSDKAVNYFRESFCQFKKSINLGCFWAEHVRLIQEGALTVLDIKGILYKRRCQDGVKIVSAFDSTYHDDSITTYEDGIAFLKGLYTLVEEIPEVFLIFKEKNLRSYHGVMSVAHQEINALYEKLERHPRCYFPGKKENASETIAFSDLTVSFPFTSTTLEALSARRRAVWFDAMGKFRDTYYDEVPGLVCHSYKELLARTKELLFETTEDSYNEYLDTYVKGKVESYLDGMAITRFRNLLNGSLEDHVNSIDVPAAISGKC